MSAPAPSSVWIPNHHPGAFDPKFTAGLAGTTQVVLRAVMRAPPSALYWAYESQLAAEGRFGQNGGGDAMEVVVKVYSTTPSNYVQAGSAASTPAKSRARVRARMRAMGKGGGWTATAKDHGVTRDE